MAPFKQARVASVLLLVLTLAAGVLIGMAWNERRTGAVVDQVEIVRQDGEAARPEMADDTPQEGERQRRQSTIYELDLDPAQHDQVDELIEHFRQGLKDLDSEMEREMWRQRGRLANAVRDSIKSILRPEQAMVYDSLLAERYGRSDRRDRGNGRGGSPRSENPDQK